MYHNDFLLKKKTNTYILCIYSPLLKMSILCPINPYPQPFQSLSFEEAILLEAVTEEQSVSLVWFLLEEFMILFFARCEL